MSDSDCFHYFNPQSENEYGWYVNNWSKAITNMLSTMIDEESTISDQETASSFA